MKVKVRFDAEADFLEVGFSDKAGFMRETKNDAVMERVDARGHVLGFSILQVSRLSKRKPLAVSLETHPDPAIERAHLDVAKRRRDEIRSGRVAPLDGESVMAKARQIVGR